MRHVYDESLSAMGSEGTDAVFLCAGALRGDSVYGPGELGYFLRNTTVLMNSEGNIMLGDIMEILPFEDSIVVLELDGETIWQAFEAGLSTWPAQEG